MFRLRDTRKTVRFRGLAFAVSALPIGKALKRLAGGHGADINAPKFNSCKRFVATRVGGRRSLRPNAESIKSSKNGTPLLPA